MSSLIFELCQFLCESVFGILFLIAREKADFFRNRRFYQLVSLFPEVMYCSRINDILSYFISSVGFTLYSECCAYPHTDQYFLIVLIPHYRETVFIKPCIVCSAIPPRHWLRRRQHHGNFGALHLVLSLSLPVFRITIRVSSPKHSFLLVKRIL